MKKYQKLLFDRMKKYPKAKMVILFPRKQCKSDEAFYKMYMDALQSKGSKEDI